MALGENIVLTCPDLEGISKRVLNEYILSLKIEQCGRFSGLGRTLATLPWLQITSITGETLFQKTYWSHNNDEK